ncbi:MAG: amidohydrolase [Candidatus Rokubacteria bacterium]|nr:amidohydrolase [Candidatus Rokubacteria bacterium]
MTTLLVNARVLTMDDRRPRAEALAIRDGRIAAVGSREEVERYRDRESDVIDLGGKSVLPGFIDPHNHFAIGALESFWADCRGARSIPEIQQRLAEAARRTPDGEWVRGLGYDHHALAERRHPTRHDLDEAVPDRPALLLHYSHHQGVASSRALAAAGITRATRDPAGGEIARDRTGEPTGLLFERAMSGVESRSREGWEDRFVEVARRASLAYAAHGLTTIEDAAVTPAMARRYAEARERHALAIHVEEMMVGSDGWFERPGDAAPGRTLKLFVDGGYRCAMRVTRDGQERTSGFLFYDRSELADVVAGALAAGRRVTCHAIGNLGVERAVDAIGDALARVPGGRGRVRIDHAIFLTGELVRRIAGLGVPLVEQPSFLYDVGGMRPPPGVDVRPFRTVRRAGIRQAFSSDFPCGSLSPLVGIHAAVTRRSRSGEVESPDEALGVHEALEASTIEAARVMGLEDDCGSLTPGKRADLIVLSAHPGDVPATELLDLNVLQTWVSGLRVYPA